MSSTPTLVNRHTDATQRLILESAVQLLERGSVSEVTVRAVARHAGMSERTVFRYYASRDEFLDAIAGEVQRQLHSPPPPATLEALPEYPRALFTRFEERAALVTSALHTDIYTRMRDSVASERWKIVQALVDARARHRTSRDRRIAAANIRYYLSATTWHYYRTTFKFTLADTIDCARSAIALAVSDILRRA